jgi:tetratricopeptide (TPR) repeat protein
MARKHRLSPPPRSAAPATQPATWRWRLDLPLLALVAAIALAGFANALRNGFVGDDVGIIEHNPRLDRPWDVRTFFTTPYWGDYLPNSRLYRPLTIMSFALDRAVFGPGPLGVHLMNVLTNAAIAILVYALALRCTRRRLVALLTALLFSIHPVHTEVVANGVGRAELGATLAMLAALHLHLSYARHADPVQPTRRTRLKQATRLTAIATLYLVALLFKESAIVLPGLMFLMEWLLVRGGAWRAMLPRLPGYLLLLVPLAIFAAARVAVVGPQPPAPQEVLLGASTAQRLLHASATTLQYIGQLAVPLRLCADYSDYRNLIRPTLADPLVLASLAAWVGVAALAVVLARRRQHLLLFALGWFFLALLPASNLLMPVGTIRADRLLFVPSLGFTLVAADLLARLTRRQKVLGVSLVLIILGFYGWRTWTRNQDWYSQDALWARTVRDNPGSAMAWFGHAQSLHRQQQLELAAQAYERAAQLRASAGFFYGDAHRGHADVLRILGDDAGAIRQYELLIKNEPPDFRVYVNLAQAYKRQDDTAQALAAIAEAIRLQPDEPALWDVKASILRQAGLPQEARAASQQAAQLRDRR